MLRVISFVDMLSPTTPAGPRSLIARAFRLSGFRRVLRGGSLPRSSVGSAPASLISRPARRSLALRPIHSLNRLTALFFGMLLRRSFRFVAPTATGWSDPVAGWVIPPLKMTAFSRRTELQSPGTGPFFGEKTPFAKKRLAENMDLSPSRQDFAVLLGVPTCSAAH